LWTPACTVMFNFTLSVVTVLCVKVMFWHKLWSVSSGATHYVRLAVEGRVGLWTVMMSSGKGWWPHIWGTLKTEKNRFFQSIVICVSDCMMSHSRRPYSNIYHIQNLKSHVLSSELQSCKCATCKLYIKLDINNVVISNISA